MKIPLIDLAAQYRNIQPEIDDAIHNVLASGSLVLGPNVTKLEEEIAEYIGASHGVGVASGTDALILALRALEIGPGDEVILPTYTFFSTVEAVMHVGAIPVFVDSEPKTYCLDIDQVACRLTARTKAVLPVHLYGFPAEMEKLLDLTKARGIYVIEDNAQAFGAEYNEQKTGSMGDVGCLSFFPSKNLGAYGDGGMVVTNNPQVAQRVRMLRTHGWKKKYDPEMLGYNSRLDELQAAILRVKLRYVDEWNERRGELAKQYTQRLSKLEVMVPFEAPQSRHVYHLYIIGIKERERVQRVLKDSRIASGVYYPQPLHLTMPCQYLGYRKGSFPVAEQASQETLAIPLFPEMSEEQAEEVVTVIEQVLTRKVV